MNFAIAIAIVLLLGGLTLVSYVDRLYTEIGRFLSREFQDNLNAFEQKVEPKLGVSRNRAALSMAPATVSSSPMSFTPATATSIPWCSMMNGMPAKWSAPSRLGTRFWKLS